MFIDTHCHISKEDYENIDKVITDIVIYLKKIMKI